MRVLACAAVVVLLLVPSAAATPPGLKLLERDGSHLSLVYLDRVTPFRQPLAARPGALAFSGDGRLVSVGGTVVGRVRLPTRWLAWAPTGERAAYVTSEGAVVEWTPAGKRYLEPKGWGATWWWSPGVAWSRDGSLAVARGNELWVLEDGGARRVVGPLAPNAGTGGPDIPVPVAWAGDQVLWWRWPGSGSVASDGVSLYEGARLLGTMLMYRDWIAVCGAHVAFSAGRDRESTDRKTVMLDGRDASRDPTRSWASLACDPRGRLVASASRDVVPNVTYETHRAIWQLLPTRRKLTSPPWGWSDEDPQVLSDGSVLFVRTRASSRRNGTDMWVDKQQGRVLLLTHGRLRQVATIGFTQPSDVYTYPVEFYGHYDWSQHLAVAP